MAMDGFPRPGAAISPRPWQFCEMAGEAGRDPASIEITLFGLGEDLDRVKRFAEMGVARVVPMFPPEKADTVQPLPGRSQRDSARVALEQHAADIGLQRFDVRRDCLGGPGT
jgi:hypothetical protein